MNGVGPEQLAIVHCRTVLLQHLYVDVLHCLVYLLLIVAMPYEVNAEHLSGALVVQ